LLSANRVSLIANGKLLSDKRFAICDKPFALLHRFPHSPLHQFTDSPICFPSLINVKSSKYLFFKG